MILKENVLEVRLFNAQGTLKFIELLKERPLDLFSRLERLCESDEYSEKTGLSLDWRYPVDRLDLAWILWNAFGEQGILSEFSGNAAVWNWLSALLFESLVNGDMGYVQRRAGEEIERWVLLETSRSYHRHHVSGPFFALKNNWPNSYAAMSQIVGPVLELSEVAERIAGKRELSHGSVAELSTRLYVDPKTKLIRKGLTDKPGEAQQLSKFFKQLDLTVDYESMSVSQLLNFLPSNFSDLVKRVKKENPDL